MAGTSDRAMLVEQAASVGMRTLQARPQVVGELTDGGPIFEVASVRLVMRPGADHFNRLVQCSNCGRDRPGDNVLSVADLEGTPEPMLCKACREEAAAADIPPPPIWIDDPRVVAIEEQLDVVVTRLGQLGDAQRAEETERLRADEVTRAGLQRAVEKRLAEHAAALDPGGEALADLDRRVAELAERVGALAAAGSGATVDQLRDAETRLGQAADARDTALRADVVADLVVFRQELDAAALRAQTLAEQVAGSRGDTEEALVRELVLAELSGVAETFRRLTATAEGVELRLAELEHGVQASIAASTARMDAFEARVQASVKRLTRLLGTQVAGAPSPPPAAVELPARPSPSPVGDGGLLVALEQQLREAEDRLSRRVGGAG